MSWDFGVEIETGGEEPCEISDRNMTYNLAPMLHEALGFPFRDLNGAPCSEAGGAINRAAERMVADPQRFKAFNPENGWGDFDGALDSLNWLAAQCSAHPKARVYVH